MKPTLKITAISDLHGHYPTLEGGDILIIAGDCTANDKALAWGEFFHWFHQTTYTYKILVGGNHDNFFQNNFLQEVHEPPIDESFYYLCDSGVTIEGIKFWGSPWTKKFTGMNKKCEAFTLNHEYQLNRKFSLIPENVDMLITHGPAFGILDMNDIGDFCGSTTLLEAIERVNPTYHIFGHIHEQGGKKFRYKMIPKDTICMNVSYLDERYKPINQITNFEIKTWKKI